MPFDLVLRSFDYVITFVAMSSDNNKQPVNQGVVDTKGFLDPFHVAECKETAGDANTSDCFPGGQMEENHRIKPGDLCMGEVNQNNPFVPAGDSNQLTHACISGMSWRGVPSHRALEESKFFQGVSMSHINTIPPLDLGTLDTESGAAIKITGKEALLNRSNKPWFPGTPLRWAIPDTPLVTGESSAPQHNPHHSKDELSTRFVYEVREMDPTEVRPSLMDIHAALSEEFVYFRGDATSGQGTDAGGIKGLDYAHSQVINPAMKIVSRSQERAQSFKWGLNQFALVVIQRLLETGQLQAGGGGVRGMGPRDAGIEVRRIAQDVLHLYGDASEQDELQIIFNNAFLNHQSFVVDRDVAINHFNDAYAADLKTVLINGLGNDPFIHHMATGQEHTLRHMFAAWHSISRTSIGTCYTSTNPDEYGVAVLGHNKMMI
jgi:hypothetical protein